MIYATCETVREVDGIEQSFEIKTSMPGSAGSFDWVSGDGEPGSPAEISVFEVHVDGIEFFNGSDEWHFAERLAIERPDLFDPEV